jgi:hypothetical protein
MELTARNPGFIPMYIYRILCKMALSIMPVELVAKNSDLFEWLLERKSLTIVPHGFLTN